MAWYIFKHRDNFTFTLTAVLIARKGGWKQFWSYPWGKLGYSKQILDGST